MGTKLLTKYYPGTFPVRVKIPNEFYKENLTRSLHQKLGTICRSGSGVFWKEVTGSDTE